MAEIYVDMKDLAARRDEFQQACEAKCVDLNIDVLLVKYEGFLTLNKNLQLWQARKNALSSSLPGATPDKKPAIIEESKEVGRFISEIEDNIRKIKPELDEMLWRLPNIPAVDTPVGKSDEENVVVRQVGAPKKFDFEVRSHYDLLLMNNWADFERASKVSGTRSYILKGSASRLEIALHMYAMDKMAEKGFTMVTVPSIVFEDALYGTGHFPMAREDVYYLEKDNMYLSGTAEIAINSMHGGEILEENQLPILYAGYSPCFRREAGAAGKDTRGLVRVHQFMKVEQFVICKNDLAESEKWRETLLAVSEEVLADLELPYQVIECCTGDMGLGKYKMHDCEAWMPSQEKYRETHSCSNLTDWQARRTNLRYRENGTNKVKFAYTLNNTALATPRIMAQILENHQTADGRVRIPEKIRPYMNNKEFL